MSSDPPPLTLTIPSEPGMLSVVRSFVEAACQVGRLDKSQVFAVVMSAGEAFTNVVRHAHREKPGAAVQIQCWLRQDAIEVRLEDQGPAFDVESVPNLLPDEIRVGGRGVYLMRTLMDELSSQPRPGGGNTLRMVKYRETMADVRDCG